MFESIILLLIQICFVVAIAYIVIWVLGGAWGRASRKGGSDILDHCGADHNPAVVQDAGAVAE